jgi:predicted ABC-type ATPase
VEARHSLLANDGLHGSSNARKFITKKNSRKAASADIEATRVFTAEFKNIIEDNDKFSQNGILSTSAVVDYNFALKTICLERLFYCLTTLQRIHQTWKMLSQSWK